MTLDQWADLDEDEPGELVDGRLVEEEVPTHLHELVVGWFHAMLRAWALARGGFAFGSEHKLGIAPGRGRKPDVTLYAPGAPLRRRDSLSRTPPVLVVEVLSRSPRDVRRDRVDKLDDYARFGVRIYCLVDPEVQLVELYELGPDGRYARARAAAEGKLVVPGLEGLELDLDALWAEVERLPGDEAPAGEAEDAGDGGGG
ncbi:Uma2 family endonuclease [Sorangium sp. So ce1036]